MELDQRAFDFIKLARQNGMSKEDTFGFLQSKGYDLNLPGSEAPADVPQSAGDYAIGLGHNLGQGATLGLGPVIGGISNPVVAPIAKTISHFSEGTPLKLNDFNPVQNFKEGYNQYIDEREDFRQKNPKTAVAAEFVGGFIPLGVGIAGKTAQAGKMGLGALAKEGAREGVKFGGLYGFNSGLTEDRNKIDVNKGLIGGALGAAGGGILGAAIPPAVAGVSKVVGGTINGGKAVANMVQNAMGKGSQKVGNAGYVSTTSAPENKVFLDLLKSNPEGTIEAINKGEPLIVHANRKQLRRTRGAVSGDENADQAFIEAKRGFDNAKIQKGEDISGRLLGEESGYTATERIAEEARNKYKPLYAEVMKTGEMELPREIITNETILGAIQEAQKRAGYTRFKGNDVRVLDKAKRILQDKFVSLRKAGKLDEAREYQIAQKELVNFMDSKLPRYPEARQAFMEGQELQEYVDLGRKLKNMPHAEVARISKNLTAEQKQAVKAGLGDSVRESLYNTKKPGEDVLAKAFPDPLRRKMRVLGIDDKELAKEINKEIQTNQNYQFIAGGSNTVNKAEDSAQFGVLGKIVRALKVAKSPLRSLTLAADKADNALQGLNATEVTRLMFDPKALAREAKRPEHQRKIAEILRKSNEGKGAKGNNAGISKILGDKLKEEGGYAMKPLDKTVNSLGEPVAKTEEGVKKFNKWFKGSKVVDENGKPLVVHHGTNAEFDTFDLGKSSNAYGSNKGFYFAKRADDAGYGSRDVKTYLKMEEPYVVDVRQELGQLDYAYPMEKELAEEAGYPISRWEGKGKAEFEANDSATAYLDDNYQEIFERALENKSDGVIVRGVDGSETYVVFKPTQIKSVKNSGKFDPKNPNIYKSIVGGLGISQILKNKEGR